MESDFELTDQVVSGSAANEKVKQRRKEQAGSRDEVDENLKWVEENVPVLEEIEDIQIVTCVGEIVGGLG